MEIKTTTARELKTQSNTWNNHTGSTYTRLYTSVQVVLPSHARRRPHTPFDRPTITPFDRQPSPQPSPHSTAQPSPHSTAQPSPKKHQPHTLSSPIYAAPFPTPIQTRQRRTHHNHSNTHAGMPKKTAIFSKWGAVRRGISYCLFSRCCFSKS